MSLFGIVAMAGVVVNDALVLIDCTNQLRGAGKSPFDAAMQAGQRRFRPVVITTLTTFCGLMPIVLEKSIHAQFLVPLAVSLAFAGVDRHHAGTRSFALSHRGRLAFAVWLGLRGTY